MDSHTTETQTVKITSKATPRSAATTALAIVGFVALLLIGITIAIYSARYVPTAISKLATEGSQLVTNTGSTTPAALTVVSATSTLPFATGTSDMMVASTTTVTVDPTTGNPETEPTPVPAATVAKHTAPYGLSDLSVTILATGYLTGDSTDTFVAANIIPPGARPAVKFSIANKGTNVTGPWAFLAEIPTVSGYTFNSPVEQSMNPGDHIVFTLGFNQALPGPAQTITVVADPSNQVAESNEGNNSAAAAVTITATGN